jgi:hypothetical protein
MVDRNEMIMTIMAGAPKHNALWWENIIRGATKDLERAYKALDFSDVKGEAQLRFGITFGEYSVSPRAHLRVNLINHS